MAFDHGKQFNNSTIKLLHISLQSSKDPVEDS